MRIFYKKVLFSVTTVIELIVIQVLSNLDESVKGGSEDYILQVSGVAEFLENKAQLKDYEYVHQCYKFDRDVDFILLPLQDLTKPFKRTAKDDTTDSVVKVEDISPLDQSKTVSYDDLRILLGNLEIKSPS